MVTRVGPGAFPSGDPAHLLAGTRRPVSCLGFRHRTRVITCALKSTGVAHSQHDSLRQDVAPIIPLSRVPLRPEPLGLWRYDPKKGWIAEFDSSCGPEAALADHPAHVLILSALDTASSDESGQEPNGHLD
ncbi:hypothetical protein DY000_02053516 [Brassica cretica]|nr:hypothetical protein DY000_02053516 [Brassica cretica]